jgi:hypothetical protein
MASSLPPLPVRTPAHNPRPRTASALRHATAALKPSPLALALFLLLSLCINRGEERAPRSSARAPETASHSMIVRVFSLLPAARGTGSM